MKTLSTVILILGIALEPIYFGYTKFFSEKEYGKHEIINQNISIQITDGEQQYFRNHEEWNIPCYPLLSILRPSTSINLGFAV